MNQTSPQTDENLAVPAHRSPHTFEVVKPEADKIDKRKTPENLAKRVAGHVNGTRCDSKQIFQNNDLSSHPVTEAYANSPNALFADRPPNLAIAHEKPEHRVVLFLKARGLSNREISKETGYNEPWVSQITRQPWFRLKLVHELQEAGTDQLGQVIKGAALDSVYTLIDLRDSTQAPFAVRKSAADSLLDRFLGKAVQKVETKDVSLPSTSEIRQVESEIASIDKQLQTPEPPTNTVAEPQPPNEKPQT